MNGLSLFANVGIAELLLPKEFKVSIANELIEKRCEFYKYSHPDTEVIQGDITDKKVFNTILKKSKEKSIDFIIATPPCQGMSNAGLQDPFDPRNQLITYAVDMILKLKPRYIFLENVPEQFRTKITYRGKRILVPDFIVKKLSKYYDFDYSGVLNTADFGVPQIRKRSIYLLSLKSEKNKWSVPSIEKHKTIREVIGHLPPLDPELIDEETTSIFPDFFNKKLAGESIHNMHRPPRHSFRHVHAMLKTPEGKSAFQNKDEYKPKLKNGKISKGFKNTYKRQYWDRPAYTITKYNGVLGSQENGHPGTFDSKTGNWDNPRVMSVYEIMKLSSIPDDWRIPMWASENLIRNVIGEAIPPLLVRKIFERIK